MTIFDEIAKNLDPVTTEPRITISGSSEQITEMATFLRFSFGVNSKGWSCNFPNTVTMLRSYYTDKVHTKFKSL